MTAPDRRRLWGNVIGGALILALIVFGAWLVNAIAESQKAQECLEARRRNCFIIGP